MFFVLSIAASFIATWFMGLGAGDSADWDADEGYTRSYFSYYYWGWGDPFSAARDLLRFAFRVLLNEESELFKGTADRRPNIIPGLTDNSPPIPPGIFKRLVQRIVMGLPVIGIGSFVQMAFSMSLLGPLQLARWRRFRSRREGGSDIATLLIVVFVVIGAARAFWAVYKYTEKQAQRLLLRAETAILEVGE